MGQAMSYAFRYRMTYEYDYRFTTAPGFAGAN